MGTTTSLRNELAQKAERKEVKRLLGNLERIADDTTKFITKADCHLLFGNL